MGGGCWSSPIPSDASVARIMATLICEMETVQRMLQGLKSTRREEEAESHYFSRIALVTCPTAAVRVGWPEGIHRSARTLHYERVAVWCVLKSDYLSSPSESTAEVLFALSNAIREPTRTSRSFFT